MKLEKNIELRKNRKLPRRTFGALNEFSVPWRIKIKAPIKPSIIPINFFIPIFSWRKKYDRHKIIIGFVVANIPLFTGVESSRPLKKESIFKHIPRSAVIKNFK